MSFYLEYAKQLAREQANHLRRINKTRICEVCEKAVKDWWKCDTCDGYFCEDHIVREERAIDDFKDTCTSCIDKRQERR